MSSGLPAAKCSPERALRLVSLPKQPDASHLVLDGAQIGQHDAKAHRHNEHQDAGDALAQAAQQHCVQRRHIRPVACRVKIHEIKVPAACMHL